MNVNAPSTEAVVRQHLQCFVEQRGIPALLSDYADDARLHSERRTFRGKTEIAEFFRALLGALPPDAAERFALRALHVDGDVAFITWSAGHGVPLGTDTFVVRGGKIVTQTVAIHAAA